jgi:hypothetical protein
VTSVSKSARWVYAAGLSYCADAESDGFIAERAAIVMLAEGSKRDVQELVSAGLWTVTDGGYSVSGYLEHNKSKADMQAAREKMGKGGAKGGGSNRLPNTTSQVQPTKQGTLLPTKQGLSKVRATEEEVEEEGDTTPSGVGTHATRASDSFEAKRGHLLRAHRDRYEAATANPVPSGKNSPQAVDRVTAWLAGYALRTGQSYPDAVEAVLGRWWADPYAASKGWPLGLLASQVDQFAEALPVRLAKASNGMVPVSSREEHAADAAEGTAF